MVTVISFDVELCLSFVVIPLEFCVMLVYFFAILVGLFFTNSHKLYDMYFSQKNFKRPKTGHFHKIKKLDIFTKNRKIGFWGMQT